MFRKRYRRIVFFFGRMLLSIAFWDLLLPRLGMRGVAMRSRPARLRRAAAAYRSLAVQMGGVLIKVGQFLSSRVDVLPREFTDELEGLQDEVPAENFEDIRRVAEAEYQAPLSEKFASFEEQPMAAASLGQVHLACLHQVPWPAASNEACDQQGVEVVVKIQRPDIEEIIATDLAALRTVGKWLRRYRPISKRANVPALLAEFSKILYEEIDYLAEGRNAETFAANFKDRPDVRVPHVVWTHTTKRTLTLENVLAIKITDYQAIQEAGIDLPEVAARLLDTYLQQIFEDGFFHADPHPGNLFVQPLERGDSSEGQPWILTFVDFGMVGHVPPNLLAGLRELLIGVGTQDSARLVKAYQLMDVLLPSADLDMLEKAGAKAFDQFWGKNMAELSSTSVEEMNEFAGEFRELMYDMPFQMPQNIIFLGRTIGILSGMCTGLNPQFNLWEHLGPYASKLIREEARSSGGTLLKELGDEARALWMLPRRMERLFTKAERGDLAVRTPDLNHQVTRLERAIYQAARAITFAALLMGGIQLFLGGQTEFGIALLGGAALNLIWLLFNRPRSSR